MTELRLALANGGTIEHDGVVYQMGDTGTEVMADWEDWLAGETLERQIRLNTNLKMPDAENRAIKAIAEMSAEGVFDYYGETSARRMDTPSGIKRLFFFRIRQSNKTVLKKTIDAMIDAKIETELRRKYAMEQASLDALLPNAQAPTGANDDASAGEPSLPKS